MFHPGWHVRHPARRSSVHREGEQNKRQHETASRRQGPGKPATPKYIQPAMLISAEVLPGTEPERTPARDKEVWGMQLRQTNPGNQPPPVQEASVSRITGTENRNIATVRRETRCPANHRRYRKARWKAEGRKSRLKSTVGAAGRKANSDGNTSRVQRAWKQRQATRWCRVANIEIWYDASVNDGAVTARRSAPGGMCSAQT